MPGAFHSPKNPRVYTNNNLHRCLCLFLSSCLFFFFFLIQHFSATRGRRQERREREIPRLTLAAVEHDNGRAEATGMRLYQAEKCFAWLWSQKYWQRQQQLRRRRKDPLHEKRQGVKWPQVSPGLWWLLVSHHQATPSSRPPSSYLLPCCSASRITIFHQHPKITSRHLHLERRKQNYHLHPQAHVLYPQNTHSVIVPTKAFPHAHADWEDTRLGGLWHSLACTCTISWPSCWYLHPLCSLSYWSGCTLSA